MPSRRPAPHSDTDALLRGVSRSFYLSIRLLPEPLRRPVALAYLLARASDTVADSAALPVTERLAALDAFSSAVREAGAASPAFVADLERIGASCVDDHEAELVRRVPDCLGALGQLDAADAADVRTVLEHITHGQSLDLRRFTGTSGVQALHNAGELDEYTYLVAGCVGEFWTDLAARHLPRFAAKPKDEMRALGRRYGMGLQLVNIIRDAGSDLRAGRCYFPADELAAQGLRAPDVLAQSQRFEPIRQRWLARASGWLDDGITYALAVEDRRVRAASALPALIGARTIALLRAGNAPPFERVVKVPRSEVRALLWRMAWSLASRSQLQAAWARMGAAS